MIYVRSFHIKHTNFMEMIDWLLEHLSTPLIIEPENKFRSVCIEITILYLNKSKQMSIIRLKPLHPKQWVPQITIIVMKLRARIPTTKLQKISGFDSILPFRNVHNLFNVFTQLIIIFRSRFLFEVSSLFYSHWTVHNNLWTENKHCDLRVSFAWR